MRVFIGQINPLTVNLSYKAALTEAGGPLGTHCYGFQPPGSNGGHLFVHRLTSRPTSRGCSEVPKHFQHMGPFLHVLSYVRVGTLNKSIFLTSRLINYANYAKKRLL